MDLFHGIPVSPGVAIGPVLVLDAEGMVIPNRRVAPAALDDEVKRLRAALAGARAEVDRLRVSIDNKLGRNYGAIFQAHSALLEDPSLLAEIESLIRDQQFNAESAVSRVVRQYAKALESLGSGLDLSSRSSDLYDIERRILGQLLGERKQELSNLQQPVLVLAHDLSPSETAQLDPKKVHGFATEAGGRTGHTAIIAVALGIPAVVGIGPFLGHIVGGEDVIVDGNRGIIILNPDDNARREYEVARTQYRSFERLLDEIRTLPAETQDGQRVTLMGNIEFPHEAAHAIARGADGIGLYRTEFLYLGRTSDPTEEEQFAAYYEVLNSLPPGYPLVIRTLDLGADKFEERTGGLASTERNPFLGLRSLRFCLQNLLLFKTQLRAILRASAFGDVQIMFPMISTLRELRQCRFLLAEVKEDLQEQGVTFNHHIPFGTMVEVPSAAILSPVFAREVDYLSIGTNDLVQYTLAADRTNEHVAELYSAADPAVLFLIDRIIKAGRQAGTRVNVCGEMSGEPIYTALLLGMGLRQFSVAPHHIPEVKRIVRSLTIAEAEVIAFEALRMETATEVTNYLRDQTRRLDPNAVS